MAVTVAQFHTDLDACRAAIEADDLPTAWKCYAMAEAVNSGLLLEMTDASSTQRRRDALEGLRRALVAAEAAAAPSAQTAAPFTRLRALS